MKTVVDNMLTLQAKMTSIHDRFVLENADRLAAVAVEGGKTIEIPGWKKSSMRECVELSI